MRPQVAVTIELASLLGQPGRPAAEGVWVGPLPAETARRLAGDATRVVVARDRCDTTSQDADGGLAARLHAAMTLLPPVLGGAPTQPLEVAAPPGWSPPPNAPR